MKSQTFLVLLLVVGASCSSPKYAYNFKLHHYPAGKKKVVQLPETPAAVEVNPIWLTASTDNIPVVTPTELRRADEVTKTNPSVGKPANTNLKKEIKKNIKSVVKEIKKMEPKSVQAAGWDKDLKMAAIFGAIGIVLGALFNVSNIIGFIGFVAVVIALVFLIKWLLRQ